jgi:hypothetical protein
LCIFVITHGLQGGLHPIGAPDIRSSAHPNGKTATEDPKHNIVLMVGWPPDDYEGKSNLVAWYTINDGAPQKIAPPVPDDVVTNPDVPWGGLYRAQWDVWTMVIPWQDNADIVLYIDAGTDYANVGCAIKFRNKYVDIKPKRGKSAPGKVRCRAHT